MKISTLLDHIDSGHMALPEFQRGYVWNRDQVRGLFDSLYRRHPVGGLLVWATESNGAAHRGDAQLAQGIVKLLLDGQQRITSLYGVVRGRAPKFFEGNAQAFSGLMFHLEREGFAFHQPVKMQDDPLWVNVSEVMSQGQAGHEALMEKLVGNPEIGTKAVKYSTRISHLLGILEVNLHVDEVTGKDKTLDVVVDIFNRVNSGGTKLSRGDLALAKICSDWPEARAAMNKELKQWESAGYYFTLDWLLRSLNTVLTGEAKFSFLHDKNSDEVKDGLQRATKHINSCLNLIASRLGLDHDRVLFGRFAIPVMVRYLDMRKEHLSHSERDKLIFWFLQAGMWGRFSGSTESTIDRDLEVLEGSGCELDKLLEELRLWQGALRVEPGHFTGWSLGARFYPVLYMLTRVGQARDWGMGTELKAHLLGKNNKLEVHHIFPKAQLYKRNFRKPEVNALANFCFQTKDTNLSISDRLPEQYFPEIESKHPGALASQWIPMDPSLWKVQNYRDFLEERKRLLAAETNRCLTDLLDGETHWLEGPVPPPVEDTPVEIITGGERGDDDDLEALNQWVTGKGFKPGLLSYDFAHPETGEQQAVFDLAWPDGLQEELSQPATLLLNEEPETLALASTAGYRCFTSVDHFKRYVRQEILGEEEESHEGRPKRELARKAFWTQLLEHVRLIDGLHADASPSFSNWIGVGRNGHWWNYAITQEETRADLYLDNGDVARNKAIFDLLHDQRSDIEAEFGSPLTWQRLDDKRACRINCSVPGGWTDESTWPETIKQVVEAMERLYQVVAPRLKVIADEKP